MNKIGNVKFSIIGPSIQFDQEQQIKLLTLLQWNIRRCILSQSIETSHLRDSQSSKELQVIIIYIYDIYKYKLWLKGWGGANLEYQRKWNWYQQVCAEAIWDSKWRLAWWSTSSHFQETLWELVPELQLGSSSFLHNTLIASSRLPCPSLSLSPFGWRTIYRLCDQNKVGYDCIYKAAGRLGSRE